jgi:hypothetical protein
VVSGSQDFLLQITYLYTTKTHSMEAMLFTLIEILVAAMAAAAGTYYVSRNGLVKARVPDAEFISLILSLCSFGIVISVIYLTMVEHIVSQW